METCKAGSMCVGCSDGSCQTTKHATGMTARQAQAILEAIECLSEWPCGWYNPKTSGRAEYQDTYTVAKARRMERTYVAARKAMFDFLGRTS